MQQGVLSVAVEPDEQAAWQEYLEETQGLVGAQYTEVEAWAWTKLNKRLLSIWKKKPKAA